MSQRTIVAERSDAASSLRRVLTLLAHYPLGLTAIVILGVLAAMIEGVGLSLFIPLFQQLQADATGAGTWWSSTLFGLFDAVPSDWRTLAISSCILAAIACRSAVVFANAAVLAGVDARVGHWLRSRCFDQLLTVGYQYIERHGAGRLVNTLATETWRTSEAVGIAVGLIIASCTAVVYTVLLLLLSVPLTVVAAVAAAAIAMLTRVVTRSASTLGHLATKANAELAEQMVDGVGGMSLIRMFNRQTSVKERFDDTSRRVSRIAMRLSLLSGAVGPAHETLSAALLVGIIAVSVRKPADLPMLLVFTVVLYRLQPRLKEIEQARTDLRSFSGAIDDVLGLLDDTDKPYLASGSRPLRTLQDALVFDEVTFSYPPDHMPALCQLSVQIPIGATTAVVGPSGAGKSTLGKLLFRLYDPDSGTISVDGHPLREIDVPSWRDGLGLVSQDVFLFNASVRDNIRFGRPDADDAAIVAAARLANAHDFVVLLPDGYDTMVGDRGLRLSGGQRQRLALARAMVRDPQLLVLDEATNALDSESERLINRALATFARDRTVLVIAHRFSTIAHADHVIVMESGRVREQGAPDTLLSDDTLFRRLHALQQPAGRA